MNLEGHLELLCDVGANGQTRIARQSFRAPVHLSKPFWEADALVLNVASPTAGLLDGDRVWVDVTVQRGARLVLTTPAATRIHTMREGRAEVTQRFSVEAGGCLEILPEPIIPQRGARYFQQTYIELAAGAELLFFEQLTPGRTAMGESFAYDEIRWETDLRVDGGLIVRERFRLAPGDGSLAGLQRRFPTAYYASALVYSRALDAAATGWGALHDLHSDTGWVGVSALSVPGAFAIKLVAQDSLRLRRLVRAARETLYILLGRPAPSLRRAGE